MRGACGAGNAWVAGVEVGVPAEQVDGDVLPQVGHRVVGGFLALAGSDVAAWCHGDAAVAEVSEQDEKPLVTREPGAGVGIPEALRLGTEGLVGAEESGPGPRGGSTEGVVVGQPVVRRFHTGQFGCGEEVEQFPGEDAADDAGAAHRRTCGK